MANKMRVNFNLLVGAILVFFSSLSEGYIRYGLVKEIVPQWDAAQKCVNNGYDGLAVVDTPARWQYAQVALESKGLEGQSAWLGLVYDMQLREPKWLGTSRSYTWGAWASQGPSWSNVAVVAYEDSPGNYLWKTSGTSYDYWVLCGIETDRLRMNKHYNSNADPDAASPVLTQTVGVLEDCGALCGSVEGCRYLAFDHASGGTCKLFNTSATFTLGQDSGSATSYEIFIMAA